MGRSVVCTGKERPGGRGGREPAILMLLFSLEGHSSG